MVCVYKSYIIQENNSLFRKPPLLEPPLSSADSWKFKSPCKLYQPPPGAAHDDPEDEVEHHVGEADLVPLGGGYVLAPDDHGGLRRRVGRQGHEEVGGEGQGEDRGDSWRPAAHQHEEEGLEQRRDVRHLGGEEVVHAPVGDQYDEEGGDRAQPRRHDLVGHGARDPPHDAEVVQHPRQPHEAGEGDEGAPGL